MEIVNVSLLKHPLNYVTVILMLVLAAMFGHLLLAYAGHEPAS